MRVGKGGGAPELVVGDVDTDRSVDLIVDDTSVYWSFRADEGSGEILHAPKSGGPAEVLAAPSEFENGVAANGSNLFYCAGGAVMALPKSGGTPFQHIAPAPLATTPDARSPPRAHRPPGRNRSCRGHAGIAAANAGTPW